MTVTVSAEGDDVNGGEQHRLRSCAERDALRRAPTVSALAPPSSAARQRDCARVRMVTRLWSSTRIVHASP